VQLYQKLLHINPGHSGALHNLEQHYQSALASNPANIIALQRLGVAYRLTGKLEEGKSCLLVANKHAPGDIRTLFSLGTIFLLLNNPTEAESLYRDALNLAPDNAALISNLGIALDSLGRTDEAQDCYRRALAIDPSLAQAHELLAYAKKHDTYDDDIRAMEKLLTSKRLNTQQRAYLNFGLGKAFEDLRDYDKSFAHYLKANALKRSTQDYDPAADEHQFSNIMAAFDNDLFERLQGCGHAEPGPIFIVGMPRSGTTLVEQILASHPDVHGAGELKHLGSTIRAYFTEKLNSRFPEKLDELDCQGMEKMGRQYWELTSQHDSRARYITDKLPYNFRNIGMIHLLLPQAKIIHCRRNPLDTCLSCFTTDFREGNIYSYKLEELGNYYALYDRLMRHWQQFPQLGIIDISYEALVNDQEQQTRRLLEACGLDWNDACLDFHRHERPVMTASVHQVRRGLNDKSIQRWKRFEAHLEPLIDTLRRTLPDTSWLS